MTRPELWDNRVRQRSLSAVIPLMQSSVKMLAPLVITSRESRGW